MNNNRFDTTSGRVARMAVPILALFLSLAGTAFAQIRGLNAVPAGAVSTASVPAPKGVKKPPAGGMAVTVPVHFDGVLPRLVGATVGRTSTSSFAVRPSVSATVTR